MPGRDALSPLFLSADTCTGVQRVCVCVCVFIYLCLSLSVFFVIAQKCQLNARISLCLSLCVAMCAQCVHQRLCTRATRGRDQPRWKQQLFLLSPNQSEEGSVTMSPAVWADGLFKSATDNSSSATTLPHALIASNEVMKETQRSQPELSCSARCSSTCLCRMSGN